MHSNEFGKTETVVKRLKCYTHDLVMDDNYHISFDNTGSNRVNRLISE